jgi:hypothetical protein
MTENATPTDAASRLAELPSYLLPHTKRLPDGLQLGNVTTGDLIAVSGRWVAIVGCTLVNGWVTVRVSDLNVAAIVAKATTPVHLARKERPHATNTPALASGQ